VILGNLLEVNLNTLPAATVTEAFLWVTLAVLVLSLYEASKGKHSDFLEYAPTLMTSLGILGTFVGVVIGLLHFDTAAIDKSIPALLDGLKTAFLTSVVGMGAAMIFNFFDAWKFAPMRARNGGVISDVTPAHIHAVLEAQNGQLGEMLRSLGGESEGSLIGQLKLLRGDFGDFNKDLRNSNTEFSTRLWQEMERFAEMLSKSATSQIIEALRQVIVDFNNKLTEQFGDNFKRLDESVQKLVVWQTQYKEQVEAMGEQYQQSVESLVHTRESVAGIWKECEQIPRAMDDLKSMLEVNQHQILELKRHLKSFVQMRDAAVQAVPTLQQKIEEVGTQLESGATNLQSKLAATGQQLLENSNKMQVALTEGSDNFRDSVLQTQQSFSTMSQDVSKTAEELGATLQESITRTHDSVREMLSMMQGSVDAFGKQLQQHSADLANQHKEVAVEVGRTAEVVIQQLGQSGTLAQRSLVDSMEGMVRDLSTVLTRASGTLDALFNDAMKNLSSDVNAKLKLFEESTLRELEGELETVGRALTAITRRFVEDYEGLVRSMDNILHNQRRPGA